VHVDVPTIAGTQCAFLRMDGQAEYMDGYIPRWFARPLTVTHPSTHPARRRLTSFKHSTTLPDTD